MEHLRQTRIEKGVSQQAVADYLGITRQAYSNYENGNREPDYETLLKLAEYFETSVDVLLRGKEIAPTPKGERYKSKDELKAAFLADATDLSQEDRDDLWDDAWDYYQYKLSQKRKMKRD